MGKFTYQNNDYFTFYNANGKGKNASDCVARAISVALDMPWETTIREMTEFGISIGRTFNEDKTIDQYLRSKGFTHHSEPRKADNTKMKIREFLKVNPNATCIVKAGSHHITIIYDGKVIDTWDSSLQTMHSYWVAPNDKPIKLNIEMPKEEKVKRRFRFTL